MYLYITDQWTICSAGEYLRAMISFCGCTIHVSQTYTVVICIKLAENIDVSDCDLCRDVITDQARFLTRSTQTQPMHSAFGCDVFKAYSLSLF